MEKTRQEPQTLSLIQDFSVQSTFPGGEDLLSPPSGTQTETAYREFLRDLYRQPSTRQKLFCLSLYATSGPFENRKRTDITGPFARTALDALGKIRNRR